MPMQKPLLTPIALAVGFALAATGCSQAPHGESSAPASSASTPAPARTAPASAAAPAAASSAESKPEPFELSDQYNPCNDFNDYVNAKWIAANPIPPDQTRWGAFSVLYEQSLQDQKSILESAEKDARDNKGSALEQKLGRLFAAGMDDATIDKLGFDPIKPQLARIDALKNRAGIVDFLDQSFDDGDSYVFDFHSGADF